MHIQKIMRKFLTILFLCLSFIGSSAQTLSFSDSTIVSLITCSPGKEAYEKFGHTAIRLLDKKNNIDVVFNYGIFSFNTSNFYYKFIKGDTDYQLGVYPTQFFLPEYKERNSMVWESVLNLNASERRTLINSLLENYLPENREYRYNFIFDNCATRPRDKIIGSIKGHLNLRKDVELKTYRQWFSEYAGTYSWLNLGLDVIFGMEADENWSQYESMFLPQILMAEFKAADIIPTPNTPGKKLIASTRVLVEATPEKNPFIWYKNTVVVAMILLIFVFIYTFFGFLKSRHSKVIDTVLLATTGLAGLIILFLMTASSHPLVQNNLNILWLNPLNILAAYLIWVKSLRKILFYYQMVNIMLLFLTLTAFALSFQLFNVAVFPIIVILLIRYSTWVVIMKHRLYKKNKFTSRKL